MSQPTRCMTSGLARGGSAPLRTPGFPRAAGAAGGRGAAPRTPARARSWLTARPSWVPFASLKVGSPVTQATTSSRFGTALSPANSLQSGAPSGESALRSPKRDHPAVLCSRELVTSRQGQKSVSPRKVASSMASPSRASKNASPGTPSSSALATGSPISYVYLAPLPRLPPSRPSS